MACNQCGNTTSSPCACKDTAYTIPANCLTGYSGQGCTDVSNTRDDIQCLECVKNCRGVENTMNCVEINGQNFCMMYGESLESFMQKLMLVLGAQSTQALDNNIAVTPLYATDVTSTNITLNWGYSGVIDAPLGTVDGFSIRYSTIEQPNNFTIITNPIIPVNNNSYTIPSSVFPYVSGQTYIFQVMTVVNGYTINGLSSTNLYITLP